MPKKVLDLETPYRKNEKVITTRSLGAIPEGSSGKVRLSSGLTSWSRYWVQFDEGPLIGSIDHNDLVRPAMLDQWSQRQTEIAEEEAAALLKANEPAAAAVESGGGGGGNDHGIPEALLERSRAAKKRLLG